MWEAKKKGGRVDNNGKKAKKYFPHIAGKQNMKDDWTQLFHSVMLCLSLSSLCCRPAYLNQLASRVSHKKELRAWKQQAKKKKVKTINLIWDGPREREGTRR